jgi:hypothetical protein
VKQKNLLRLKEKLKSRYLMFLIPTVILANEDSLDYDIWNDVSWDTITHINEVVGEVQQVTSVAGVRGDEAESEILKFLWYRKRAIRKNG